MRTRYIDILTIIVPVVQFVVIGVIFIAGIRHPIPFFETAFACRKILPGSY